MANFNEVLCARFQMELICVGKRYTIRIRGEAKGIVRVITTGGCRNGDLTGQQDDPEDKPKNLFHRELLSLFNKTVAKIRSVQ